LIAEILRREAGGEIEKLMIAGLVLIQRTWCWEQFLAIEHKEKQWVLDVLRKYGARI
jgi:hypothetical protein